MYDKKLSMFYILEILKEYSDRNHLLKQKDIIDKLHNIYNIDIERKTISSTLELLSELGYDICKDKGGVCLNERDFDETQIRFLIDAIYSSKIITAKQAKEISEKLYSSLSKYQRKDYSYIHKSTEIIRTQNNQVFLNIEIISEAIKLKKKITFKYLSYNNKGELIERRDGYIYKASPYFLINNFGKYYLICNVNNHEDHSNYRLDYITDIRITNEEIYPMDNVKTLGKDFNINKHINDHVYMFGGNIINAKILIKEEWAIKNVYDWFGSNARIKTENDKLYAYIRTDDRAFLYWALQYCEDYKVIEPEYLKKQMIEHAKAMLNDYEG